MSDHKNSGLEKQQKKNTKKNTKKILQVISCSLSKSFFYILCLDGYWRGQLWSDYQIILKACCVKIQIMSDHKNSGLEKQQKKPV